MIANSRREVERPEIDSPTGGDAGQLMLDSFIKAWTDLLPQPDEISNLVFWDRDVLNEIDSEHL